MNTLGHKQTFTRPILQRMTPPLIAHLGFRFAAATNKAIASALLRHIVTDYKIGQVGQQYDQLVANDVKGDGPFLNKLRHAQ